MKKLPKWMQRTIISALCAALAGGGIYGILLLARGSSGRVNVYPVTDFITTYADDQAETQGRVVTDKLQSVYISSTQTVTEVYVKEGDAVHVGDRLLAFDTTLTDLELERKSIAVQKLGLELEEAKEYLAEVNTYRAYVPAAPADQEKDPDLQALSLPFCRTGAGTAKAPYVFIWNDDCTFDTAFIDSILPQRDPGAETGPSVCAVFEVRQGDAMEGNILRSWMMTFWRTASGGWECTIREPEGNYDGSQYENVDNGGSATDSIPAYSYADLIAMRQEAQNKVFNLELDLKKAELEYETLRYELSNGIIYSQIDGVVKTVRSSEEALSEQLPVLLVSGGGGYYVTGVMSEVELETLHVGDTVTVMSWQTYSEMEAKIVSISEYPVEENGNYYHWSQGNSNSSLYPFTVYLDEETPVREGEWVNITYNPFGSSASGLFLNNMFIRREGGKSFVYAQGAEGRLEQREIATGRSLWGSYTQVMDGLTEADYIAFPYGRSLRPGAKTTEASSDALYNY